DLLKLKNPEKAKILAGFFKTGKGQYGEGDILLGVNVPDQRKVAKRYLNATLKNIQGLLSSKVHEQRLTALLILIAKYQTADTATKKRIFDFYLKNTKYINNWDLVDISAGYIVGDYLLDKERTILYRLAASKQLWERRIAIMATFKFIREDQFEYTLNISKMLLNDEHDLIHKAVGWMLREVGKRDKEIEKRFLRKHYKKMPRTMLRYAIERFSEAERRFYLSK
ncbi:MAG: DNA alkylation repair protein, partial [Nitrospirota bacterium]